MFNFTLSSDTFNKVIKRLVVLTSTDPEAVVSFYSLDNALSIYYHSRIDKGSSNILYWEKVPTLSLEEKGLSSLYINQLFSLKVPEFVDETKYPNCKEVNFRFLDNILTINFNIQWSRGTKPNETTLNFPLLEKPAELDIYNSLLNAAKEKEISILASDLSEGISICNFIKTEVTSKEANGCLFQELNNALHLVSTDSTIAAKWSTPITKDTGTKEENTFSIVVSNTVLNSVKNFLLDCEEVTLTRYRQGLLIETEDRKMIAPLMKVEYIISNIEDFFTIDSKAFIGSIDLKPFINITSTIGSNNKDLYKKIEMDFSEKGFNISTNINKTEDLPAKISSYSKFFVNSDYMLSSAQRLLSFGYTGNLYYDKESHRITFTSMEDKLIFLIQGLSF
jgi:hypothetical protein